MCLHVVFRTACAELFVLLHISAPSELGYDENLFIFLFAGLVGLIGVAVEVEW